MFVVAFSITIVFFDFSHFFNIYVIESRKYAFVLFIFLYLRTLAVAYRPVGAHSPVVDPAIEDGLVLLGIVALRSKKQLRWFGPNMTVTNVPEANQFLKAYYREGWELPV